MHDTIFTYYMKHKIFIALGILCIGFLSAFIVRFSSSESNPLGGKESIGKPVITWFFQKSLKGCLHLDELKAYHCVNEKIRDITRRFGARFALDVIEPISQNQPLLLTYGHDLSHTIGDNALYRGAGIVSGRDATDEDTLVYAIGKAIVECDGWGSFGCYHGVVEVGLSHIKREDRTRINQCMHWFGHGMAIFTEQTLAQTLAMCEGVSTEFQDDPVQLCLSGVFHAGAMPGTSDPTMKENIKRLYDPDNVYFPCQTVEERFRGHCYSHVAGRSRTGDVGIIMKNCEGIPESDPVKKHTYVNGCYESIGNNLLINGDFTGDGVKALCMANASPAYYGRCFGGAARYAGLRDPLLNNTIPFDVCQKAPVEAKSFCYGLVGFANFENYKSRDILTTYCSQAEKGYEDDCQMLTMPEY
jgi:hypothetical protein